MDKSRMTVSHRNMNDGTVEGVRYKDMPVSYRAVSSEASPGPEDTAYLFDEFIDMMKNIRVKQLYKFFIYELQVLFGR